MLRRLLTARSDTAALKRFVWPMIHDVMKPPYEPPITPRRSGSMKSNRLERGVDDRHHVLVVARSPARPGVVERPADRAAVLLRVAGAAARVREEDDIAAAAVDLDLVEEGGGVLRERAAVDRQERGIALARLEAGRPDDPRVDLVAVRGDGGEALGLRQLAAVREGVADVRRRGGPRCRCRARASSCGSTRRRRACRRARRRR